MTLPPAEGPLPVRRTHPVATGKVSGLVVEIDPTRHLTALAVLQAGLHEQPEGTRLIHGYRLELSGLGAWVGDRRIRLHVWPALIDEAGEITEDHPDEGGDELVIEFDPQADAEGLAYLSATGRVIIAAPDAGPVPLVVDIDPDDLLDLIAQL